MGSLFKSGGGGGTITSWVSFVPTSSTWISNVTFSGFWRRVGDTMQIQFKVALGGTPSSANLTITIPTSYTIDTAKLVQSAVGSLIPFSTGHISATGEWFGACSYNNTTSFLVKTLRGANSNNDFVTVTQAVPQSFANNDYILLYAAVPIVGWT